MREIKFRVWKPELNLMVPFEQIGEYDDSLDIYINNEPWCYVMQYTGLKDKNGKEIYEGDIIEWNGYDYTSSPREVRFKGEVVFLTHQQAMWPETDQFVNGYFVMFDKAESGYINLNQILEYQNTIVIGNVWENPELLKGKTK